MIGTEDRCLAIILLSLAGTYVFTLLPFPWDFPPESGNDDGDRHRGRPLLDHESLPIALAVLLPANTPPNAIAYAMGYFKTHEMLKVGLLLTVASILLLSVTANLFWTF